MGKLFMEDHREDWLITNCASSLNKVYYYYYYYVIFNISAMSWSVGMVKKMCFFFKLTRNAISVFCT